jgi:hypothetical protein
MPFRDAILILSLAASLCAQQASPPSAKSPKPQAVFIASNPVYKLQLDNKITTEPPRATIDRPIPIPPRVRELIKEDPLLQEIIGKLDYRGWDAKKDLLLASEIDLGCTRGVLVVGEGPLRGGSQAAPFWIFTIDDAGNYQKPFAVVAEQVEVHGRGKSCRDVRTGYHTRDFHFRITNFRLKDGQFIRQRSWYGAAVSSSSSGSPPPPMDTQKIASPQGPLVDSPVSPHIPR